MPRLILQSGAPGGSERSVPLGAEPVTIGRDAHNTVVLEGETKASRRHCEVVPIPGGGWEVADLGSTNGTMVNGQKVTRRRLGDGDLIEVGATRLRFEDEAAPKDACWLEWAAGERRGERISLASARVTIGRREGNTIALADKMASGHHAEILRDLNGYTIRDLGSTNGTLVNGMPVSEVTLSHGARLRIGNSRFVFKDPAMAHVEVELEHLEEDDGGWGMMGDLEVAAKKGGGGLAGVLAAVLLLGALGAGAYLVSQRPAAGPAGDAEAANRIADGGFDSAEVLAWTVDEGVPAIASRETSGGRPGRGGYLAVRHDGKSSARGLARYAGDLESSVSGAYRVSAWIRRDGQGLAALAVQWLRFGNAATGATAVVQTDIVGDSAGGAWAAVSGTLYRPGWAEVGRLVVVAAPGTTARVDDVFVEPLDRASPAGGELDVPGDARADLSGSGRLAALVTKTVIFAGACPWARMPDGRVLGGAAAFRAEAVPVPSAGGFEVRGTLHDEAGEVPASVRWAATGDGLSATVRVEGAAATGLAVDVPVAHLESGVGVIGSFGSRSLAAEPSAPLDAVRRVLLGDPEQHAALRRPPTLFALDIAGGAQGGQLALLAADDDGLLRVSLSAAGPQTEVRLVTAFEGERQRAHQALREALAVLDRSTGEGIARLRQVAEEFPFQEDVRRDALARAAERENQARRDLESLSDAVERARVLGDQETLAEAEGLARRLAALFPAAETSSGALELSVRDLAGQVRGARARYELRRASADVRRLFRLAELLELEPGYEAVAAVYFDTIVRRYAALEGQAAGIAEGADAETLQRVRDARTRRDALLAKPEVSNTWPGIAE